MPSRKKQATNPAQIKISSPELVRLIFVRDESAEDITSWGNIQMQFQVGVARLGMHRIGIELQVELKDLPATECKVAYRAGFAIQQSEKKTENQAIEKDLRDIVLLLAPATLYPFLREAVASTAARASLPPLVLPLVNFRVLFRDLEVVIPPYTSEVSMMDDDSGS